MDLEGLLPAGQAVLPGMGDTSPTPSQGCPCSESPVPGELWVPQWLVHKGFVPQQVLSTLGQGCVPPSGGVGCRGCPFVPWGDSWSLKDNPWLPLSSTKRVWGAWRRRFAALLSVCWDGTGCLRCTGRCPRAAGALAPPEERQHMGTVSWRPSQPGICPGGGGATTKAGRDCSQGRGRGGRER